MALLGALVQIVNLAQIGWLLERIANGLEAKERRGTVFRVGISIERLSFCACAGSAFQFLAIDTIHESKTNPRKTFDAAKLFELAESIRQH